MINIFLLSTLSSTKQSLAQKFEQFLDELKLTSFNNWESFSGKLARQRRLDGICIECEGGAAFDVEKLASMDIGEVLAKLPNIPIYLFSDSYPKVPFSEIFNLGIRDVYLLKDTDSKRIRCILHQIRQNRLMQDQIIESQMLIQMLKEQDPLTGLTNRSAFEIAIGSLLKGRQYPHRASTLIIFNINRFKYFNDTYGHQQGDALLIQVAERVKKILRPNELLARTGSDEFALMVIDLHDSQVAFNIAKRIISSLSKPFLIEGTSLQLTVSVGIAVHYSNGMPARSLLKNANIALHKSKQLGQNKISYFSQRLYKKFTQQYLMEEKLRQAIPKSQFELKYQPFISLIGRAVGCEALLRWQDPESGLVNNTKYIKIAEQSNLILIIGQWIIEQVCQQISQWQLKPPFFVSINVSASQLKFQEFSVFLEKMLKKYRVPPEVIMIEVTETALLSEIPEVFENMNKLAAIGCRIALDDFGTGFSSIQHLRLFPISAVKIDKSLTQNYSSDLKTKQLFEALMVMLNTLELATIVEGIETEEQLQTCRMLNAWCCQGFYFDEALSAMAFSAKYLIAAS